ncbi:MAG TPA: glycosyltransferase family 4 protein [Flavisolibacter sp.]|jgi:glycosyltransferase involved in cell wall biosynthesis|nr:glycosyltransferase family 4 protein [Flavisolibacter sp.]
MKIIMSHPTGNANVRAAAIGFAKAGILSEFDTAIASFPGSFLDRLSKFGPLSEISRRRFDPVLRQVTRMYPWTEVGRLTAAKAGLNKLIRHETGKFSVDAVYRGLDAQVEKRLGKAKEKQITAVYAYEDGAYASFSRAKILGIQCIYDLPIGYWRTARRLLKAEQTRWPDWAVTLTGFRDSAEKLSRKDEELKMADRIFVASRFTAKTLLECPFPLAPITVIPYGFPPVCTPRQYKPLFNNRPLKVLFVGGLSQRKGLADLFAAIEVLDKHVSLTIVGQPAGKVCNALEQGLRKHQWISSLPHKEILLLMQQHDVFVFPSLFEGFGLVITEAMSQGTPVITTERTAGPDLINDGENGWIVESGSTEALIQKLSSLLSTPRLLKDAGMAAMETASKRPWETYGDELAQAILETEL